MPEELVYYIDKKVPIEQIPETIRVHKIIPLDKLFEYKWSKNYEVYKLDRIKPKSSYKNFKEVVYKKVLK